MRSSLFCSLSLLCLPATLLAQGTSDVFEFDVVPPFRGTASGDYAGWDAFTVPFGGTNLPDDLATNLASTLEQLTPGAILTSTLNIYCPSGAATFVLEAASTRPALEVIVQARTFGSVLDASSFRLTYFHAGTEVTLPPTASMLLNPSPGAAEETYYRFDLSATSAATTTFQIHFDGTAPHVSLDAVMLDIRTEASLGTHYCSAAPNSTGVPGVTTASGSAVVTDNALALTASDLPTDAFAYFLASRTQDSVSMPGGSQGTLCVGGEIGRFTAQIFQVGPAGEHTIAVDLTQIPSPAGPVPASPGESWNFQCWHRDTSASASGATSNFTLPVSIALQ